jgi:hypothetical protein
VIKPPEPKIRSYLVCEILPILLDREPKNMRVRLLACEGQRAFHFPGGNLRLFFRTLNELNAPVIEKAWATLYRAPGSFDVAGWDSQKDRCCQSSTTSPWE